MYELIRYDAGSHTPGVLTVEGVQFKLEGLPWKNNQLGVSCVEDGIYEFFKDISPNKDNRVVVELRPRNGRSQIQLHVGELPQLAGCFGHASLEKEILCRDLLPPAGLIRVTTINNTLKKR